MLENYLPILIFLYNYGWPRIREYFREGLDDLDESRDDAFGEEFSGNN